MPLDPLPHLKYLDPRSHVEAVTRPLECAVNIPLPELRQRIHELPERSVRIQVVGPEDLAMRTILTLRGMGRAAEHVSDASPCERLEVGRLWKPNDFLTSELPQEKVGRALDFGCGTGRDAVFMAAHGWTVDGIDRLPDAVERAGDLASRYLPTGRQPSFYVADLKKMPPLEARVYDLITCFFFFEKTIATRLTAWLKPGGMFLMEHFTPAHQSAMCKPRREVYGEEDLKEILNPLTITSLEEDWRHGAHTVRLKAECLG